MFENVDGRTDDRVTGILIAHLGAFGSGELKIVGKSLLSSICNFHFECLSTCALFGVLNIGKKPYPNKLPNSGFL